MDTRLLVYVLGALVLLSFVGLNVGKGYVSDLADWNYMREVHLAFDHSGAGPFVVTFPLPSDENFLSHVNGCADVRFTVGSGSGERLLTSWTDGNCTRAYVLLGGTMHGADLRIYYGNPSAQPPSPLFDSSVFYSAPPFSEDDFIVRYCGTGWHGNLSISRNYIRVAYWDRGCGSATLGTSVPDGAIVRMKFWARGWGNAVVYIAFTSNSVDPSSEPSNAVRIVVKNDGKYYYQLYRDGSVVNEDAVRGGRNSVLVFVPSGGYYRVYSGNSYLGDLPRNGDYLSFIVARGNAYIKLKSLWIGYDVVEASAVYGPEVLAPKAPSVTVSPSDGTYLNTSDVPVVVSVSDPNQDVNSVVVVLDGNVIFSGSGYDYSDDFNLSDGVHTLQVTVTDSEGIQVSASSTFTVDTVPPVLDLNYDLNGSVLHVEMNARDDHLDHCYYGDTSVSCTAVLDLNVSPGDVLVFGAVDMAGNVTERSIEVPSGGSGGGGGGSVGGSGGASFGGGSSSGSGATEETSRVLPSVSVTRYGSAESHGLLSSVSVGVSYGTLGVLVLLGAVLVYFVFSA